MGQNGLLFRQAIVIYLVFRVKGVCLSVYDSFLNTSWSQGNAILGTKAVLCNIDVFWYHCTGIPFQFYLIIFLAALVLLLLYILSCSYVLVWLLAPSCGSLSNTMEKFESNFKDLKDGLDENEFQGKESVIMSFFMVWSLRYIIFK